MSFKKYKIIILHCKCFEKAKMGRNLKKNASFLVIMFFLYPLLNAQTEKDWVRNGDDLIEPQLFSSKGGDIKVVAPNVYLPQKLERNQSVYVLIPIGMDEEISENFLDKEMIYLSVR